MKPQSWEGNELDKDLLQRGNNIYSKNTCIFLPAWLNTFISDNPLGKYAKGVTYKSKSSDMVNELNKPFLARVKDRKSGCRLCLGTFETEEEAHKAWQLGKRKILKCYIEYDYNDSRITLALKIIYKTLSEDIEHGRQTRRLW